MRRTDRPQRSVRIARFARIAALAAVLAAGASAARAHEIPSDVVVRAFIKPEGERLRVLLRAPLEAMRDIVVPTRGPGYLDLARVGPALDYAATVWIADYLEVYENDAKLGYPEIVAVRVSLPSDRSFDRYETALEHVLGPPLPEDTELYWEQGLLDVALDYRIASDRSDFAIRPRLEGLGMRVIYVLRFLPPDGAERAFELVGDPGLLRLDPRWHQAALTFVRLGFDHILDGIDHLLFLFCLVIPFRRLRPLVLIVTAFTVAHSVTLVASALGFAPSALWFPPLVETLIAASIVYMAFENIAGARIERRWLLTFAFGLVHGFGFSFALGETLQLAGAHLLTSLLSFNVGVELGQLLVLVLLVPALELLFRYGVRERLGTILLSALVAHTAWHWMVERLDQLRQFPLPALDVAALASLVRWAMALVAVAAVLWLLSLLRLPALAEEKRDGD